MHLSRNAVNVVNADIAGRKCEGAVKASGPDS
jgi:hypothetical protein